MKLTTKQIITIIITTLVIMFLYEFGFNAILYDDKKEILDRLEVLEKKTNIIFKEKYLQNNDK